MTSAEIKHQIDIMKEVAEMSKQSKEFALKFLKDAGILNIIETPTNPTDKSK